MPQVYVPQHPLVAHWLAVCRNKMSPPPIFRSAVAELGRVLIYEAAADWLPTVDGQVETPLALADVRFVDPNHPVKVNAPLMATAKQRVLPIPIRCLAQSEKAATDSSAIRRWCRSCELGWCFWSRQQRFCRHQRRIMWAMSGMRPHCR